MPRGPSISRWMIAIAILALHAAFLGSTVRGRSLTGMSFLMELGLLQSVSILVFVGSGLAGSRGKRSPFALGFVTTLLAAMIGYVVCFLTIPEAMSWADLDLDYVNELEPEFLGGDRAEQYAAGVWIRTWFLALPQLGTAVLGGLMSWAWHAHRARSKRRTPGLDGAEHLSDDQPKGLEAS